MVDKLSQTVSIESDSEKVDRKTSLPSNNPEMDLIDSDTAARLEVARSRPDIKQAETEFLQENLSKIELLEQAIEIIEVVRDADLSADTIGLDFSEAEKDEMINEMVKHILSSEWYARMTEVQTKLSQVNRYIEIAAQPTSSKKELKQALKQLGIPYNKALLPLSPARGSYAIKLRGLVRDKSSSLHEERRQLAHDLYELKHQCEDTHAEIPSLYCTRKFPDYRKFPDFKSYERAVGEIVEDFKEQLRYAAVNPVNIFRIINPQSQSFSEDSIRQAASLAIDEVIKEAHISWIKSNMAAAGVYSRQIAQEMLEDSLAFAKSIFNESSLPAYYIYSDRNEDLAKRLNLVSGRLNRLTDSHHLPTQPYRVDILGQLERSAKRLGEFVDSSTDLYWHATPVIDLIIEAGELSPRVDIDIEKRVTNTGDHSKGVHFSREGFDYLDYSLQRGARDADSNSRGYSITEGPYAVVASLGAIVEQAPYRIGEVASELPSNPDNPYRRKFKDSDVVFWGDEKEQEAFDYDIPLADCFIVARESQRANLTSQLSQAGYSQEWIDQHLILFPDEFVMSERKWERIGSTNQFRFSDGRIGRADRNEAGEPVIIDEKTNRPMRFATAYDRIESYVSRRIKEQLSRSVVVPLRVKTNDAKLEPTDNFTQVRGQTRRRRPIREHVQSETSFAEVIEQMTIIN